MYVQTYICCEYKVQVFRHLLATTVCILRLVKLYTGTLNCLAARICSRVLHSSWELSHFPIFPFRARTSNHDVFTVPYYSRRAPSPSIIHVSQPQSANVLIHAHTVRFSHPRAHAATGGSSERSERSPDVAMGEQGALRPDFGSGTTVSRRTSSFCD